MLNALRDYIRPLTVAALVAVLLLGAVISGTMEAVRPGLGVLFTKGVAGWFIAIPQGFYELAMVALLGYTAARTVEKATKTHARAKYERRVDDPDAVPEEDLR